MKRQPHSNTLGQNRIDYIVHHNADEASKLLEGYGFEAPNDPRHLAEAIKELARKKGRKVIKELLGFHPDKEAILKLNAPKKEGSCDACNNDSYDQARNHCMNCGHSNQAGSGNGKGISNQFENYKDKALESHYQTIVKVSNANPQDKGLAQEVQMVWNEIRTRRLSPESEEGSKSRGSRAFSITKDEMLLLGVAFIAGALVGHGLKFNFNNVK